MKKTLILVTVLALLVGTGLSVAAKNNEKDVIFFVNQKTNKNKIKKLIDVHHETDEWISGTIKEEDLETATALAEATEIVGNYEILNVEGNDEVIEPGFSQRSRKPGERLCTPEAQIWNNVEVVNGGQIQDGAGVKIAILDTGAMTTHPDLDVFVCKDATQGGIIQGCQDDHSGGHGTHTLGIATASAGIDKEGIYGVSPRAQGWMLKVCDERGSCRWDDIARAIDYAADHGTNIISMSFGGSAPSLVVQEVIQSHPEVLFVSSAGNRGGYDRILYPAAWKEVIGVGGLFQNKVHIPFSSQGRNDGDFIIEDREIEFSAIASAVLSPHNNGCYSKPHGTSFAAPAIAGVAAKVWHEGGNSASEVREFMHSIAEDLDIPGDDPKTGFGLPIAP